MTSSTTSTATVFVGGPFKGLIDPVTGAIDPRARHRYTRLIEFFSAQGCGVFNAHTTEGWGQNLVPDTECTARDLAWMRDCDVFVAFPGAPASPGTHVEIGWASALGKPMVLVLEPGVEHAALVTGLHAVAPVVYVEYADGPRFEQAVGAAVASVTAMAGDRGARAAS
ncbi:nucleoside 2-deoxyribosyltransferase [Actinokineospora sp. 24-640]